MTKICENVRNIRFNRIETSVFLIDKALSHWTLLWELNMKLNILATPTGTIGLIERWNRN
jgi:hypothetical protein